MVALLEVEARPLRPRAARAARARSGRCRARGDEHGVGVPARGLDVGHELEGAAAPAEGHAVDHAAQEPVALRVARVDHLDAEHHRRVLGPARVVLHQRPDAGGRVGHLEAVAVLAHATRLPQATAARGEAGAGDRARPTPPPEASAAPAARGWAGTRAAPRRRGGGPGSARAGPRRRARASRRASAAPRQKCAPRPKERWRMSGRRDVEAIGVREHRRVAVRRADAAQRRARSPAASWPPSSTSSSGHAHGRLHGAVVAEQLFDGVLEERRAPRAGARAARGCRSSASVPLPIRLVVVSWPARSSRKLVASSSCVGERVALLLRVDHAADQVVAGRRGGGRRSRRAGSGGSRSACSSMPAAPCEAAPAGSPR